MCIISSDEIWGIFNGTPLQGWQGSELGMLRLLSRSLIQGVPLKFYGLSLDPEGSSEAASVDTVYGTPRHIQLPRSHRCFFTCIDMRQTAFSRSEKIIKISKNSDKPTRATEINKNPGFKYRFKSSKGQNLSVFKNRWLAYSCEHMLKCQSASK